MSDIITPFDVYKTYLALRSHFTSSYDYIKYNGVVKASQATFERRNDKYFFQKLAKRKDWFEFILANMIKDPKLWIGDLVRNEDCEDNYVTFTKTIQSLSYIFKSEIGELDTDFNSNFMVQDGQHPPILKRYLKGDISPETLIILDDLTGCFKHWNGQIKDTIIWPDIYNMCMKYKPFLSEVYNKDKFKKIVVTSFQ